MWVPQVVLCDKDPLPWKVCRGLVEDIHMKEKGNFLQHGVWTRSSVKANFFAVLLLHNLQNKFVERWVVWDRVKVHSSKRDSGQGWGLMSYRKPAITASSQPILDIEQRITPSETCFSTKELLSSLSAPRRIGWFFDLAMSSMRGCGAITSLKPWGIWRRRNSQSQMCIAFFARKHRNHLSDWRCWWKRWYYMEPWSMPEESLQNPMIMLGILVGVNENQTKKGRDVG